MRRVVVVSGPPGAGKTTLAAPLAAALGLPLLSKDVIKETLFDTLGHVDDDAVASSRKLGAAAMDLLWRLAGACPAVVIEANFRSGSPYERRRLRELSPHPVEVYCRLPAELAAERYARRNARPDHHPVHVLPSLPLAAFAEFQEPMGLGPVREVDTTAPVDVAALADWVRATLAGPPPDVWVHPDVARSDSAIHGNGLVARRDIAAGTVVVRLGGRLASSAELDELLTEADADAGAHADNADGYVDTITVYDDAHLVLPPRTAAHWCNHSCDPNLWHVGPYELATRRLIRAGDELTVDYATSSGAAGFRIPCRCGSHACRGEVTGDDWRRPDLQARYRGHWTPALQSRIDAGH